jgi:hypothetical protein
VASFPKDIAIPTSPAEPVRFAATELATYLRRMGAGEVRISERQLPAHWLVLGGTVTPDSPPSTSLDGFCIRPTSDGAVITAESTRGVLYGVYRLLQQYGCRWALHRMDERVPVLASLPPVPVTISSPRFEVRGYSADIMTWHYGDSHLLAEHLRDDGDFIDWMAKSGANVFQWIRHPIDTQFAIPELLPELRRRGIDVEYGGHVIPILVPRDLFPDDPTLFPESAAGVRTALGNVCVSNPRGLVLVAENAVACVREHPELTALHVWGADLWGGGWCRCTSCRTLTAQDQSLRLCNVVGRALGDAGMPRRVCYLAYHDTLEPDLQERADESVVIEFAPRERCYGHSLNDQACATNRRYRDALERYADLFGGRVRIFEYYADAILFCGCAVPLCDVIAADLDFYHSLGVREITNLQFGSFSLWAYPVNFLLFAAATWRPDAHSDRVREQYGERFGALQPAVADCLGRLERIMRGVVTYGDIRRPPKNAERAAALRPSLDNAIADLMTLSSALPHAATDRRVSGLGALVEYNRRVLQAVRLQLDGRASASDYEAALEILRNVNPGLLGVWGREDLPRIHAYHSAALGSPRGAQ